MFHSSDVPACWLLADWMDLLPDNAVRQEQLRIRRARVASAIDAEWLDRVLRVLAERRVRVGVRLVAALSTLLPKRRLRADPNEDSCIALSPVLHDSIYFFTNTD